MSIKRKKKEKLSLKIVITCKTPPAVVRTIPKLSLFVHLYSPDLGEEEEEMDRVCYVSLSLSLSLSSQTHTLPRPAGPPFKTK